MATETTESRDVLTCASFVFGKLTQSALSPFRVFEICRGWRALSMYAETKPMRGGGSAVSRNAARRSAPPNADRKTLQCRSPWDYTCTSEAHVMATNLTIPPPGFDDLSLDDQIDYVQSLWDRIAARPDQVPIPEWHRQVIHQRIAEHDANPSEGRRWEEVRSEIRNRLSRRSSKE